MYFPPRTFVNLIARNKWLRASDWIHVSEIAKELNLNEEEHLVMSRYVKDTVSRQDIIDFVQSRFDRFRSL